MKKIFYGWWIVLATSLIHFWGAGTFFYSFTAFFNPIKDEFGWSYAATSFALSLRSIEGGIASPLVGFAVDRYGTRRLIFLGSLLGGTGFILFSQINSLLAYYLIFIFISIGASLLFPVPGWTAVAHWFDKRRGTALGIQSTAIGFSGVLVYLMNWLIGQYGWRTTLIIIGIGMWVIGIPLSLVVRHRPEPYGLVPDGDIPLESLTRNLGRFDGEYPTLANDFTLRQALRTKAFWLIALTVTISVAALNSVVVHVMPYLLSINFDRERASIVASLLVLTSVAGRFGLGWLGDRMDKRYLLGFGLLLQGLGLVFLIWTQTLWHAIIFALFFGPGFGGIITLRLTLQAEYFGRRAFGGIQGLMKAIICVGTVLSPFLTGMVFDLYQSYHPAWLFMTAVTLASILLLIKLRPPHKGREE